MTRGVVGVIDADCITLVKVHNSNHTWVVSFAFVGHKCMALELSSVTIRKCQVFLGDAENQRVLVKICKAPDEMPDTNYRSFVLLPALSFISL